MTKLDADAIRRFTQRAVLDKLAELQVFSEIDSTNSYLMQEPGPQPGEMCIAATSNQTAGRGRYGKTWQSPPGAGLCLSAAYTYAAQPDNLPALTLALGLATTNALEELGVSNVQLKWPNDLVARDGKLGGILTEVQHQSSGALTVVVGIGINVDVPESMRESTELAWAGRVTDLNSLSDKPPSLERIAGVLMSHLFGALVAFEADGFAPIAEEWAKRDWLRGQEFTVKIANSKVRGTGAGISADGSLLVDTPTGIRRFTHGSIELNGVAPQ